MTWSLADTNQSIPERFEQQARRYPDKEAVGGASFAELDAAANLHALTVLERLPEEPGRIALLLPHDARLFAAALGVLKAGKTVVTLNTSDPAARLGRIRADAEAELVLADAAHRDLALRAGFAQHQVVIVGDDGPRADGPGVAVFPDDIAFLIYTSGSTGAPKGVMQTHRNMLHNVLRHTSGASLTADDRVVLLASMSSGQGVGVVWSTLLNGATLCPFPTAERGVTGLPGWLEDRRITVFVASASVFRSFVRTLNGRRVAPVRLVRLASEPALHGDFAAFRRHFPETCLLLNTFSSSEAGNIARCLLTSDADVLDGSLPVGRPAEGMEVFLLDEDGSEVPLGETGEIVVRSDYLSPGYWRNPALTAARFTGELFRTGDLGRLSEDGLLSVSGRRDFQVKVRGFRVELSEIEAALAAQTGVAAAAVSASSTPRGDTKLTAFVSAEPGRDPTAAVLREGLRRTLPEHAVPTAFVSLPELPLTAHGKVDRSRLAEIASTPRESSPAQPAPSETEELLAELWSAAFEAEVGRDDDFFELGGDSLTAAVIAAGVFSALGVELGLQAFVDSPSVAAMAQLVERGRAHASPTPLGRASRAEPLPMSFAQERVWLSARTTPEGALGHNMSGACDIVGPLDPDALGRSIEHIVRRHEVLRTTFAERAGRLVQLVQPPALFELPLVDCSGEPAPEERSAELLARHAREPFDLETGPLLRLLLARIGEDEHRLLRANHHIVSDGWSWQVFFGELAALYTAFSRGEPSPLPDELPRQYGDFAVWQRRRLDPAGPVFRAAVAWWREAFSTPHEPIVLPFTRAAPPAEISPSDGLVWWGLRPEVSRGLDELGRANGATYFMTRLAVFAAQLALEAGREDIVIGTYVTNRRLAELQAMFGDFTNLATLRLRFDPQLTFLEWLTRVRACVLATSVHTELPYPRLVEELGAAGVAPPGIRAIFGRSHQLPPMRFGGLEVAPLAARLQLTPTGFTFLVNRWYEADACHAYFDPGSYDPEGVRAFADRYQRLAQEVVTEPECPLRRAG